MVSSYDSGLTLSHKLELIIRRPPGLRKTQAALNALQKLACDLVAHNVRLALIAFV